MVQLVSTVNFNRTGGMERWAWDLKCAIEHMNYDIQIITDDKALYTKADLSLPHLYYLTTPRRSLYDMCYYADWKCRPFIPIMRVFDRGFVKNKVENIACISHTVRTRIEKVYQKTADVIYPCVHCDEYYNNEPENFWLMVNRVDKWKRIELQVEIAKSLPEHNFIVIGPVYDEYKALVENAPENMNFVGKQSNQKVKEYYSTCIGHICTSIDEDFGITPLEAMASGKPVVAVNEGGFRETIVNGSTGILCDPTVDSFTRAIHFIQGFPGWKDPVPYRNRALEFDYPVFKKRIEDVIGRIANE